MLIHGRDSSSSPSFTIGSRALRLLWEIIWITVFFPSPRGFHSWRSWLLRAFGAQIGSNVHIYPSVRIWAPWNLEVGDNTGVGSGAILYSMNKITLGKYTVISQRAHVCCGSHDIHSANFQLITKPIRIGDYSWICAEAFIGPGVTVPEGCVIAARAVLTRSISVPWTVWAGNPAIEKGIRERTRSSGRDIPSD